MKTERIRYTRGDRCTQPGGIIMRRRDEAPRWMVHHFNRAPGSTEPTHFFWGSYHDDLAEATEAFRDKRERAKRYTTGGSLIAPDQLAAELEREAGE
jgi:hypothetical protein